MDQALQEAIPHDATSHHSDLSGVTCPIYDVGTPSTGGTPAGTSNAALDPVPAIALVSQPTTAGFKAAPPNVSGSQPTMPPLTTSTPPKQILPAKAAPLAPPTKATAPTAFMGSCPALIHLADDRLLGAKARSPCVSVPSSTRSLTDGCHSRSMDAAASKIKGAMVKMHADEAGVVNEKLVALRFDMEKATRRSPVLLRRARPTPRILRPLVSPQATTTLRTANAWTLSPHAPWNTAKIRA